MTEIFYPQKENFKDNYFCVSVRYAEKEKGYNPYNFNTYNAPL